MTEAFERRAVIIADRVEQLPVEFGLPEWGWIKLTCPGLIDKDAVHYTEVDDPFDEFIAWLESIAGGAQHAVWQVAEEGCASHFVYLGAREFAGDDVQQLIVTHTSDGIYAATLCPISRRVLVRDFYTAFRRMAESPDYELRHWEYMGCADDENAVMRQSIPLIRDMRSSLIEVFIGGA